MKEIPLTRGKIALVDDEDYEAVARYHWCFSCGYAKRQATLAPKKTAMVYMHRLLVGAVKGQEVDHINMNKLDNRRANLRLCTPSQNKANQNRRIDNRSGFKGVCLRKRKMKWEAQIAVGGHNMHLGYFADRIDAARAYDAAAMRHFGEFARLNFPEVVD